MKLKCSDLVLLSLIFNTNPQMVTGTNRLFGNNASGMLIVKELIPINAKNNVTLGQWDFHSDIITMAHNKLSI